MVVICCSFNSTKAQTNNIYAEFLGLGLLGSINYERMVKDNIFARASYGGFSVETTETDYDYYYGYTETEAKMTISPLSFGAHYLRGNKWKLEAGAGVTYWMIKFEGGYGSDVGGFSVSEDGGFLMFYTSFGFRYQNPEGGLTFKAGVSPIIAVVDGESGTIPWPHLALGYSF